jgi:exosortase
MSSESTHTPHETRLVSPRVLLGAGCLLIMMIWLFWDFVSRQVEWAIEQQADWGHTLVIPFIAGYFVYLVRDRLLSEPFRPAWTGLVLILVGLGGYVLCSIGPVVLHHHNLMGIGVGITIFGVALLLFGWRAMRWLWFPLAYLVVFTQTVSERFMNIVTYPLQDIAASGAYQGLGLLGFDVTKAGNNLILFYDGTEFPINIVEACSGMRMLMAFLALGFAMAYTSFPGLSAASIWGQPHHLQAKKAAADATGIVAMVVAWAAWGWHVAMSLVWSTWRQITLVALAVPTAIFVNILRVMTLAMLMILDTGFAAGDFHTFVGTLWLIPAFFIYLGIVWLLRHLVIEDRPEPSKPTAVTVRFSGQSTRAFVVAVLVLGGISVGLTAAVKSLNVHLKKAPVALRDSLATIPPVIGSWRSVNESRMDASGVEALGTDLYLSRIYQRVGTGTQPTVSVHLAYYTGQVDTVPHVPDRCMVAAGFEKTSAEPSTYDLDIDTSLWIPDREFSLDGEAYPLLSLGADEQGDVEHVRMPLGDLGLRTTEFRSIKIPGARIYAGYFFVSNGRTTPYPERIRTLAFDLHQEYAYYCKVQFTAQGDGSFGPEEFTALVEELLTPLLGHIMHCLPDWAEVNSPTTEASPDA